MIFFSIFKIIWYFSSQKNKVLRQGKPNQVKGKKGQVPRGGKAAPISMDNLQSKHPVSLLGELASKRRWGAPNYCLVSETGPAHAKNFIFKVWLKRKLYQTWPKQFKIKKLNFSLWFLLYFYYHTFFSTGPTEWYRLYMPNTIKQQKRIKSHRCKILFAGTWNIAIIIERRSFLLIFFVVLSLLKCLSMKLSISFLWI